MTTTNGNDMIDVIISDHRDVDRAFADLQDNADDPKVRREIVEHVIAELVRHSIAEEQYLYPTARKVLEDGDSIADHEIEEHAEVEKIMKELEKAESGDAHFEKLLNDLISNVRHHVKDEEQDLLPKMKKACSAQDRRDLGEKILKAKEIAPTRPHPKSPNTPPANLLLAPGAGLVDKIRDTLTGRSSVT